MICEVSVDTSGSLFLFLPLMNPKIAILWENNWKVVCRSRNWDLNKIKKKFKYSCFALLEFMIMYRCPQISNNPLCANVRVTWDGVVKMLSSPETPSLIVWLQFVNSWYANQLFTTAKYQRETIVKEGRFILVCDFKSYGQLGSFVLVHDETECWGWRTL